VILWPSEGELLCSLCSYDFGRDFTDGTDRKGFRVGFANVPAVICDPTGNLTSRDQ
jgi:hypothetical protein